jgi:hypothetical protein
LVAVGAEYVAPLRRNDRKTVREDVVLRSYEEPSAAMLA